MECNKDEAIRAKGIAEKKMEGNDFVGAHRIAIKAQRLYPDLESISQMICVCDVHCSAENKNFGNEKYWYDILRVEQSADEVSIKKQYRKLALLLHPDKNKFAGAEAAFILIGEAQKLLLDGEKRSSFDARYMKFCQNTTPNPPPQENKNPNNVRPPSVQNNTRPPSGHNNVRPPSDHQNKTTKNASSHVEKQPKQQAPSGQNNTRPPSSQNNTTKNASSHVKKQPQQQAPLGQSNTRPPSDQNNTRSPLCQNDARPPSGQNNATKNSSSHAKKQPQQQAHSEAGSGNETFFTVCPFCATKYRYFKYALNTNLLCQSCQMNFKAYAMCAESTNPKCNANKTAAFARAGVPNQGVSCNTANGRSQGNAGQQPSGRNAKQTAACARGVPDQGGSCSASNARFQGNSRQQKPIVDSFAKYSQKSNELNMRAQKISGSNIGKTEKKPAVESGRRLQSKSSTGSKDTAVGKQGGAVAGSRCGGDSSSHQRSSLSKRHVDETLNSSKRFKWSA